MASLLRGARTAEGVYTTLRWGAAPPASWPLHCARLQRGAAALGLPVPMASELHDAIQCAVDAAGLPVGELRVRLNLLAADPDPTGHLLRPAPDGALVAEVAGPAPQWGPPPPASLALGGPVRDPRRALAGHKLLAIAEDLHWRHRARAEGHDDALLCCHIPGQPRLVSEATTATLLLQAPNGQWSTPAATAAPVWSTTLQALRTTGLRVVDRRLTLDQLLQTPWQGVWLLSALVGARPVRQIGTLSLPLAESDLQERLKPLLVANVQL